MGVFIVAEEAALVVVVFEFEGFERLGSMGKVGTRMSVVVVVDVGVVVALRDPRVRRDEEWEFCCC